MSASRCRDTFYGQHGVPNTQGKCPYCGEVLGARGMNSPKQQLAYEEYVERLTRRANRDLWGGTYIPPEQDPEIDPDPDDSIYD